MNMNEWFRERLDKRISETIPTNGVTDVGIKISRNILLGYAPGEPPLKYIDEEEVPLAAHLWRNREFTEPQLKICENIDAIFSEVGDRWVTPRGTFPKRVAKSYKKLMKEKPNANAISQIGVVTREHSEKEATTNFAIKKVMDWGEGVFGDSGSCFFGSHRQAVTTILSQDGGYAFCLYSPSWKSEGRCWVICQNNIAYIFNGYTKKSRGLLSMARIIATVTGTHYRKLNLSNYGTSDGIFYINNSSGYAIGDFERVCEIKEHDFRVELRKPDSFICSWCGDENPVVEMHMFEEARLCHCCYDEDTTTCERCGSRVGSDGVSDLEDLDEAWCSYCVDCHAISCAKCGYLVSRDSNLAGENENICKECAPDFGYVRCYFCDRWFLPENGKQNIRGNWFCENHSRAAEVV